MTTLTVKVDVDPDTDRIAVWKDGIGWVEMDRGWFADLLRRAESAGPGFEALGKAMAIIELLVYALRFHNLDEEGDPKTCLPGCIACQAIAAWVDGAFTPTVSPVTASREEGK